LLRNKCADTPLLCGIVDEGDVSVVRVHLSAEAQRSHRRATMRWLGELCNNEAAERMRRPRCRSCAKKVARLEALGRRGQRRTNLDLRPRSGSP
jgi:hypothetical protein